MKWLTNAEAEKGKKKAEAKKKYREWASICTWPRICSAVHCTKRCCTFCDCRDTNYWFLIGILFPLFLFLFASSLAFLYFHSCSHPIVVSCMDWTGQSPGRGWPCYTPYSLSNRCRIHCTLYLMSDRWLFTRCTPIQLRCLPATHVMYVAHIVRWWSLVIEREGKARSGVAEPLDEFSLFDSEYLYGRYYASDLFGLCEPRSRR